MRELQRAAPAPVDVIALPEGAPFGAVELNVEGCTLCLACVSACPTGALLDDPERPMLRFAEDACVQCGLCKATCPEKVITLTPQLDFRAATASARVLKQEEPFGCIRCGKPFGVKSTIERVTAKLEGKHWMYQGSANRLDVAQDVRGLPRDRRHRGGLRPVRRAAAPERAHHGGLSARARGRGAQGEDVRNGCALLPRHLDGNLVVADRRFLPRPQIFEDDARLAGGHALDTPAVGAGRSDTGAPLTRREAEIVDPHDRQIVALGAVDLPSVSGRRVFLQLNRGPVAPSASFMDCSAA